MGVITGGVTEKIDSTVETDTPDGIHFLSTAQRIFQVVFDSAASCSNAVAKVADGIPRVGVDVFPNSNLLCITVSSRRVSPFVCEVTCSYSTVVYSLADIDESPINAPPVIRFTTIQSEESFDVDAYGNPIQLITGEPFDPAIRVPVEDDVIEVTRNLLYYDPVFWSSYNRSSNSDYFLGLPPGTVHLGSRDAVTQNAPNIGEYFTVTAQFIVRRAAPGSTDLRAWWRRALAQGYYTRIPAEVFDTAKDLLVRCVDDHNVPSARPKLHTIGCGWPYQKTAGNSGVVIANVSGTPFQDSSKAEWYEFPIFNPLPYSALQIL